MIHRIAHLLLVLAFVTLGGVNAEAATKIKSDFKNHAFKPPIRRKGETLTQWSKRLKDERKRATKRKTIRRKISKRDSVTKTKLPARRP